MSSPAHNKHIAIAVENLVVAYDKHVVVDDVSFKIEEGDIVAFLGPNGSGKTTLMKAILGLVPYQRGLVQIFGDDAKKAYGNIGYVPQRFTLDRSVPMTVEEFLSLARVTGAPKHRVKEVLEEVGLNPATVSKSIVTKLSGGQLQRVLIARALLNHPKILFLDEPEAGIDVMGEKTLFGLLKKLNKDHGTTIVIISHEVQLISSHVKRVICLNGCLVCNGPPSKAITDDVIRDLYGDEYVRSHNHERPHA